MDSPLLLIVNFFFKKWKEKKKENEQNQLWLLVNFIYLRPNFTVLIKWKYRPIVRKTLKDNSNTDTGPPPSPNLVFLKGNTYDNQAKHCLDDGMLIMTNCK